MPNSDFFPQRSISHPRIYAYKEKNPQYAGLLKVGYTEKDVKKRVAQHIVPGVFPGNPAKRPDGLIPYEIVLNESAKRQLPLDKRVNGVNNG